MAGGERIPLIARIMHLANELEVHARLHRAEAAVAMADYRAGGAFDPHLVWLFCQASGRVLEVLEARSPWEAAMAADPGKRQLSEAGMDRAAAAMASFTDLKSDFTHAPVEPRCPRLNAEWTHNRSPDLETIRYRFGGWSLPFAAISVSSMLTTSRLRPSEGGAGGELAENHQHRVGDWMTL